MPAEADWDRIAVAFQSLVGLPAAERAAGLDRACGTNAALRQRLEAMLAADGDGSHPLDTSVAVAAAHLIGGASDAPRRIGPYQLDRLIGEGGSAVVYLATRPDVGHQIAIKILRDAWLSPARRERFLGEQRTLAQLSHPSIAHFHDADLLPDGTPWLAMEYVAGVPLTDFCARRQLDVPNRLRLIRAVAEAVQYAHRHAVIHRDLKPSNILVNDDGQVKLVDFGIAKHLETIDETEPTRTGLRMLTPAYAAPEQLGRSGVGTHTDVYALGVVLYQVLTGQLPFDLTDRTPEEAVALVTGRPPPPPSTLAGAGQRRAVWSELDVLCATAMHADPLRRYRDMDGFIRDIDHFLAGEPLEARPDSVTYRAGKFARRHAGAVAAAAVAVLALVTVVTFYTVRLRQARDAALEEASRAERAQRFTQNLFEGGDATAAPAETLRVLTLLDRGLQEARSLERDPRTQAELFLTLGAIYQKLGALDRADTLLTSSVEQRRRLAGPSDPSVAAGLVALGLLRMDQARYDEAENLVREAIAIDDSAEAGSAGSRAAELTALGRILEARGDYPAALGTLTEAVRLHALADTSSADYVAALTELANTNFYAGQYDRSDSLNRIVLAMDQQRRGPRHPAVAEDLINLGATEFERGKYPEAETFYRQALDITTGWYGENHFATAANLTMLGRALVREEKWDEATATLGRALVIRERVFGPMHPNVASTLNELGTIELRRERYPEAERYYQRALAIYRTTYQGRHYLIGIALSNIGSVRLGQKDNVGAEQVFREAFLRFSETLPEDHSNVGIIRIKLGRSLLRQRRYPEAIEESARGHDIMTGQASPSIRFLEWARADLDTAYRALGQPEEARAYQVDSATAPPAPKP
jgi:serine/threonine-protein kinase